MTSEGRDWGELLPAFHAVALAPRGGDADTRARLERARRLIHARFDEPLPLERIAREACLSPYHFQRLFRWAYGETPHQHLTRRRLERARALLADTDASVTEVCLAVGFSSLGSFSGLFARHVGDPPARFRRRLVQVQWPPPGAAMPLCFQRMWLGAGA